MVRGHSRCPRRLISDSSSARRGLNGRAAACAEGWCLGAPWTPPSRQEERQRDDGQGQSPVLKDRSLAGANRSALGGSARDVRDLDQCVPPVSQVGQGEGVFERLQKDPRRARFRIRADRRHHCAGSPEGERRKGDSGSGHRALVRRTCSIRHRSIPRKGSHHQAYDQTP